MHGCIGSSAGNRQTSDVLACLEYSQLLQVVSIQLGIPIRVIRKNPDKDAMFGNVFVYDGLYNVVRSPQLAHQRPPPPPPPRHIADSQPAFTELLHHLLNVTTCCFSG